MSLLSLLVLLVIAAVCGSIGRAIAGGSRGGCLVSIATGFIGAFVGSWLARHLHFGEPIAVRVAGQHFPIMWSIIGATLFVAVVHLIAGRGRG